MHLARGFSDIGYNCYIPRNGPPNIARHPDARGAHVAGFNNTHFGICLEGGLDPQGRPEEEAFTGSQLEHLEAAIRWYLRVYPTINQIGGHRDFSPDLDGDGVIERHEWLKKCPCMSVTAFLDSIGLRHLAMNAG